jgi:hypothetical protein
MCPCGVPLQLWRGYSQSESHVHLVNRIGVRVPSGDGGPAQMLEMAVPCELQTGSNALSLGAHCELVTSPGIGMTTSFLRYKFTISNAQRASMPYMRARQLHCPVQLPSDIFFKPSLGRLMKLLRIATGTLGSGKEEQISW